MDTRESELNLDEALQRHRPLLLLLAEMLIDRQFRNEIEASDVVQKTLLEAYRDRHQFAGGTDSELQAWLRRILRGNMIDEIRRLKTHKHNVSLKRREADFHDSLLRLENLFQAEQSSPSQRVMRKEQLLRLSEAMEKLTNEQREAIRLKHLNGWTLAEISAHLNTTVSAVGGLLFRGRARLRELMAKAE